MLRCNIRFNDRWTPETLTDELRTRLGTVVEAHGKGSAKLSVAARPSRSFVSPVGGGVELLSQVIEAATGRPPELSTTGGTSDARFIAQYCPVAELGLVGPSLHKTDEHVAIADVEALTALYHVFIARFLAAPPTKAT